MYNQIATVPGAADDPAWLGEERLLIQLVDELHDSAGISDELWTALLAAFSVEQIFELIAPAGFYHTVSHLRTASGFRWSPSERRLPNGSLTLRSTRTRGRIRAPVSAKR